MNDRLDSPRKSSKIWEAHFQQGELAHPAGRTINQYLCLIILCPRKERVTFLGRVTIAIVTTKKIK
jgi:hypothetical protein